MLTRLTKSSGTRKSNEEIPELISNDEIFSGEEKKQPAKKKKKKVMNESAPWCEKYRPKSLDDVAGQDETIKKLKAFLASKSMLNMIFVGDEGTGKTSTALIVAGPITGYELGNLKHVNASMFGRIDFLKKEIIPFCKSSSLDGKVKVLILDEFDYASQPMQASFRRVMEEYSANGNCIFIIICNYEKKVIPAIHSRCARFDFGKVSDDSMILYGKKILDNEGISYKEEDIEKIAVSAKGKPRNFVNILQKNCSGGSLVISKEVEIISMVRDMLKSVLKDDSRNIDQANMIFFKIMENYTDDCRRILSEIHDLVIKNKSVNGDYKVKVLRAIMDSDYRLSSSDVNGIIQMTGLLATLYAISSQMSSRK